MNPELNKPVGLLTMVKSILIAPSKAFESVRDHRSINWLFYALFVLIVISGIYYMGGTTLDSIIFFAILAPIIGWVTWGIAIYIASKLLGGNARFFQTIIMTIWASFPDFIRDILSGFGLPTFGFVDVLPDPTSSVVWRHTAHFLLTTIDIFFVWKVVLLIIGLSIVACFKKKKSTIIIITLWILGLMANIFGPLITA